MSCIYLVPVGQPRPTDHRQETVDHTPPTLLTAALAASTGQLPLSYVPHSFIYSPSAIPIDFHLLFPLHLPSSIFPPQSLPSRPLPSSVGSSGGLVWTSPLPPCSYLHSTSVPHAFCFYIPLNSRSVAFHIHSPYPSFLTLSISIPRGSLSQPPSPLSGPTKGDISSLCS